MLPSRRAVGTLFGVRASAYLMLVCARASAEPAPGIDVRTWSPSVDPRAGLALEPSTSTGPWSFAAAASLHYDGAPVTLVSARTGALKASPLDHELGLDVVASFGLGARGLVGLRVPMALWEDGSSGLPSSVVGSGHVPSTALGDLALDAKGTLVRNERGGFGLASLGELSLPTGTKTSFLADKGPTVTLRLLAEMSTRLVSAQASAGLAVRTSHVEWPTSNAGGLVFGNTLPWTVGLVVHPGAAWGRLDPSGRQAWEVALHGALPAGPVLPFGAGHTGSAAESPALLALSDRIAFGHFRDGFVLLGLDIGLDDAVGVPSARAVVAVGWTFARHDADADGIADDVDRCPDLPEDRDGFEDMDGCPEVDNDDDGFVDAEDACPNVPGVASTDSRKNGCPLEPAAPSAR